VNPVDEVLRAFDDLDRATEGSDPDKIVRLFVDDPDITFWGSGISEQAVGRSALRALAKAIAGAPGSFEIEWEERRVSIRDDVAWVNARGTARWVQEGGDVRVLPYRLTAILLREADEWLWHTVNGSEPQPD